MRTNFTEEIEYQDFDPSMLPAVRTRQVFPYRHPIEVPWIIQKTIMVREEYVKAKIPQKRIPRVTDKMPEEFDDSIRAYISLAEQESIGEVLSPHYKSPRYNEAPPKNLGKLVPLTPRYVVPSDEENLLPVVVLTADNHPVRIMQLSYYAFFVRRCPGCQIYASPDRLDYRLFVMKDGQLVGITMEVRDKRRYDLQEMIDKKSPQQS